MPTKSAPIKAQSVKPSSLKSNKRTLLLAPLIAFIGVPIFLYVLLSLASAIRIAPLKEIATHLTIPGCAKVSTQVIGSDGIGGFATVSSTYQCGTISDDKVDKLFSAELSKQHYQKTSGGYPTVWMKDGTLISYSLPGAEPSNTHTIEINR